MSSKRYPYKRKDSCRGCGRHDPCGVHYDDCTLLEPGDLVVARALAGTNKDYDEFATIYKAERRDGG